jgi:HK97 family phage prohead protease
MIQYGAPLPITETKARDDSWEVAGYASTFGNIDLGNDVVLPGAFDRWLAGGQKTRFLYSHRPDKVLGVLTELKTDKTGLLVRGRISKTPLGEEVYTLVQDGAVDSWSIGYQAEDSDHKDGVRRLKDVNLLECSLVAIPMNPQAVVTAWKDWLSLFGPADAEAEGQEAPTLVEKAAQLRSAFAAFFGDTRQLVEHITSGGAGHIDRPLSNVKRQELTDLLALCAEMDAVRSDLASVLAVAPTPTTGGVVDARRALYELGERRARLAHILQGE